MAKTLTPDEVNTTLRPDPADGVDLNFKVTFPKKNQIHVVVTPMESGDNVATLTKATNDKTAETTLKFVAISPGVVLTKVKWEMTVKANFDTKVLSASGKGDSTSDYSFDANIATW